MSDALILELPDLGATQAFAARLAHVLQGGDLITLRGQLGVGKSEFARAVIRSRAGFPLEVPSPTFTIIQDYDLQSLRIRHIDLYRISSPEDLVELDLDRAPDLKEAWMVEWPERADGYLSGQLLDISLEDGASADSRIAHLVGDKTWKCRLDHLLNV